ncbi:MAG TPA: 7-cyano-7-deazaguanine synthase [Thermoanaerobaculia bacterium]|jgi:7-cyano-7-deazaguanine synthase|nr:7-cyano-7-deazaguanine synthase [Thermoanaerobaculia bacterium]
MSILLLSGGYDSTAIAWRERPNLALTFDYGQTPAAGEIRASRAICSELGIAHEIIAADLRPLGSGDLAGRSALDISPSPEWWPYRNQMLLTFAAMRALQLGERRLIIGTVSTDAFHGDGQQHFFATFNDLLLCQEGDLRVETPAIELTTQALIRDTGTPRRLLAWCHSCHVAEWACGQCRGCLKALAVRQDLGYGNS